MPEKKKFKIFFFWKIFFSDRATRFFNRPATRHKLFPTVTLSMISRILIDDIDLDYILRHEKSFPYPSVHKGNVKKVDECASLCRGKYNYFCIGRQDSSSCDDDYGCQCMCGNGKYIVGSPTYDTYQFKSGEILFLSVQ